jgi:hypothetical protein
MSQATTRTIKDWSEASKMPPIFFIVERSYIRNQLEVADDAPRILNPRQLLGSAREKVGHGQVLEWLEAGKITQQEYYAKLAESPEWQALFEQHGKPGLTKPFKQNPEERKYWATDTAKKQGWL